MKPPRLRRFVLIVGTLLSVLLATAFVLSAWGYLEIGIQNGPYITIAAGAVDFWWPPYFWRQPDVWQFAGPNRHGAGLRNALFASTRTNGFTLPLVYPFAAVAVPTLLVWRFGRKRVNPGQCRNCGYDLTGNVSGRCPECGATTAEKRHGDS